MAKEKYYLIEAEIYPDYPQYTFIVNAKNEKQARKRALDIIENDYGEFTRLRVDEVKNFKDVLRGLLLPYEVIFPCK